MEPLTLPEIERAAALVRAYLPPTPQITWPLLSERAGCEVVVKHENHTPTGAFKVRGGLVLTHALRARGVRGIATATRGNHGLSLAFAGRALGLAVTIVVPRGNNPEKNAAMRALGADLVERGADFDEARTEAAAIAAREGLELVQPFDRALVCGVATWALELFRAEPELDALYVPIGMGSGCCGALQVRDLLGLPTRIVGVVAAEAPAFARSVAEGRVVTTDRAPTFADGLACRQPLAEAVELVRRGAERVAQVTEAELAAAVLALFTDTHNLAEGAGAAGLAALLQEKAERRGKRVAVVLSGGNIDLATFRGLGERRS